MFDINLENLTRSRIDHFNTKNATSAENTFRCCFFTVSESDLYFSCMCLSSTQCAL